MLLKFCGTQSFPLWAAENTGSMIYKYSHKEITNSPSAQAMHDQTKSAELSPRKIVHFRKNCFIPTFYFSQFPFWGGRKWAIILSPSCPSLSILRTIWLVAGEIMATDLLSFGEKSERSRSIMQKTEPSKNFGVKKRNLRKRGKRSYTSWRGFKVFPSLPVTLPPLLDEPSYREWKHRQESSVNKQPGQLGNAEVSQLLEHVTLA